MATELPQDHGSRSDRTRSEALLPEGMRCPGMVSGTISAKPPAEMEPDPAPPLMGSGTLSAIPPAEKEPDPARDLRAAKQKGPTASSGPRIDHCMSC